MAAVSYISTVSINFFEGGMFIEWRLARTDRNDCICARLQALCEVYSRKDLST